ncbi:unnamed protein product [Linum trigynum]|uniref:Xyloglucan endotransglucosylase/hydrolase n=2 Tax=Linum trigynum TaxID=586398 RepID=A0AAV2D4F3_9ROSI
MLHPNIDYISIPQSIDSTITSVTTQLIFIISSRRSLSFIHRYRIYQYLIMGSLLCYRWLKSPYRGHYHEAFGMVAIGVMMIMLIAGPQQAIAAQNFFQDVDITWGGGRGKILDGGNMISLSLDRDSGSGFQSKLDYMYARIDTQIKLVPGNSAGTVVAYYMSSQGPVHDEIDFEFLGNVSGQPYILHTNVYTHGQGSREMQFYLWFDPTRNFHTYTIIWKPQHIIFMVDEIPIRVFKNLVKYGIPYPRKQPMKLYSSLWDAEDWATRGGLVKTDWTMAPFTAYFRNLAAHQYKNFTHNGRGSFRQLGHDDLGPYARKRLRWAQMHFMIYDYCTDFNRFPQGPPPECKHARI